MNTGPLGQLLKLRYRLLWAQVRLRNGKIALFLAGYLFVILIILLIALGGLGAAFVAIRMGKAELIARVVLGSFYLNALMASIVLGVGMSSAFTDAALRRYPLSAIERLAARQLTAFLEPLWMFVLALDLSLAIGFWTLNVVPIFFAIPAAVLLVVTNYLLARLVLSLIERIMATRSGPLILVMVIMGISLGPAALGPVLRHHRAYLDTVLAVLTFTPPFAAASVMAGAQALRSFLGLLFLLSWCVGLAAALYALEKLPMPSRSIAGAVATWGGFVDRFAALFPAAWAPLVGKTLRYYIRSNKVRYNYVLAVPLVAFLVATQSRRAVDPRGMFITALAAIFIVGFIGTSAMDVNVFGYDGSGFRRYLLAPVSPTIVLQAVSLVSLILGAVQIPIALATWLLFSPVPTDARMLLMLFFSAVAGLFFYHGLSIWVALLSPRKADYYQNFGNQLSFAANVVVIGGILSALFIPQIFRNSIRSDTVLHYWWTAPLLGLLMAAFYLVTIQTGTGIFVARREQLLSLIEGRS